ncbi:MAG: PQQ-dependent sugar dehydrogenase [Anaerolineales bacterium]
MATIVACTQSAPTAGLPETETEAVVEPSQPEATSVPTEQLAEPLTETPVPNDTPLPAPVFPDPEAYTWAQVGRGFNRPLLLTHARDGSGRLFVVEQGGKIWILENGGRGAAPFLDIDGRVGSESNEQGLLGLAFPPDYEQSGVFYVDYTDVSGDTVISRFRTSTDPDRADAESEEILLQVNQPAGNHNGGHLEFGPDGYLYVALGDGGSQGDPSGNGQSLDTLLGKILRIDVGASGPYGIPTDNPFANGGGRGEIWGHGLRNPWRFSFDAATGDLYIGDVGQGQWEEINFLPGGYVGPLNFGWNYFEGTHAYEGNPPSDAKLTMPVAEYEHGSSRCSVTGGYVYRGPALPAWHGVYLYADYCSGEVFGLAQLASGVWESRILYDTSFLVTSFGVDEAGEIYVIDRGGGLYQLRSR